MSEPEHQLSNYRKPAGRATPRIRLLPALSGHWRGLSPWFGAKSRLAHRLQLVDHAGYDREPPVPELGILGVEPKRLEQFGIVLGAAGRQHCEVAFGKAGLRVFVGAIERVHETIAEGVGVNIERRMDEVRDVHPEILITGADIDRRA